MVQQRRSEFFSLQGGGRLLGSDIAENGCCAKAQGISHSIDVVELMLRTVCLKGSFSAMFQQKGEGFIQWRKLARHLPIFPEKSLSVLLSINDEMMQVDVFPPHCYL